MKSLIEVRKFAVEKAVEVLGAGTAAKDVVEKAREIEVYIVGSAELPEVYNDVETAMGAISSLGSLLSVNGVSSNS